MSALKDIQDIFKQFIYKYEKEYLKNRVLFNDDVGASGFYEFMKYFKDWLYESIHKFLTPNKYDSKFEITIRTYCNYIRDKILPV